MMPDEKMDRLLRIMARLRDREAGCLWDREQTSASIAGYTLEEAYEVYDAVERNDDAQLKEELGDLLFHVVFHSRIAEEKGSFSFSDVVKTVCDKMIRRHPHIFGHAAQAPNWEVLKQAERESKDQKNVLSGIAKSLPAATRAFKLQNRAARVGFDWDRPELVLNKIAEEMQELRDEIAQADHEDQREDEMGDLLFACVNLARKLGIDPEKALKRTNEKFERRFSYIERKLKERGQPFEETNLDEMEKLWVEAKNLEHERERAEK